MENRYRIILTGNQIYKEAEIPVGIEILKIGTHIDCDVRLRQHLLFEPIEIVFEKENGIWTINCSDNIYFTEGDTRKFVRRKISHGDILEVRYQDSENLVFRLDFHLDFDNGKSRYERVIDLRTFSSVMLGSGLESMVSLLGDYAKRESVCLIRGNGDEWNLEIVSSEYGVYHNGKKVEQREVIRNGDFFSIADYFFFLKNGKLRTEIRNDMSINGLSYRDFPVCNNYPVFGRNTRLKTVVCEDKIEILDPPAVPQEPKNNLFMRILPSLGILVTAGAMAFLGGAMILFSLISSMFAIITAVLSVREAKKEFAEQIKKRREVYQSYIASKKQEIEQYRNQEWKELNEIYVPMEIAMQMLEEFSPNLFDRIPEDEDFLCVRLGSGPVPSIRPVNYKEQEKLEVEDDLGILPKQIAGLYKELQNAPVVCNLKKVNGVGITGSESDRFEMLKVIVADVALRQFASDVKLFFVAEKEHENRIHWLRFLPGVYCTQTDTRGIVNNDESKNIIFEYLYKELTQRELENRTTPHLLAFFYDEYGYKKHPLSKFTDKGKELGITFLFFGETRGDIPVGCDYITELTGAYKGNLISAADRSRTIPFFLSRISDRQAAHMVQLLAPVCTEEVSLEGALTKNISMFEMLNILAAEDLDLQKRWKSGGITKTMAAPIGVSKTGIVNLDLHDKAHGPHGLVAGTTGAGKSEILQTYILSMATLYHPYDVAFVIIDFKGGGMVNQFMELPHLLGAITNIDGKAIDRSLKSIKAELQKRQKLFAEADVNHIDKYIKKYKAGEVQKPLPHLIIIVDEFAELKAEQPEFMKELISAARIGRSLGVHLILATQKPAGQVNEQIWSNSRFKLCLKVQSPEDSNEVLKSPLAAEIKEPGRAYLQVGNNEIFELFQSAYSGAAERTDENGGKEFSIYEIPNAGKKQLIYAKKKHQGGGEGRSQLDAIVSHVSKHFRMTGEEQLSDICLPALAECIVFPKYEDIECDGIWTDIGIYDDPEQQYQGAYSVNLSVSNLMIIGSSQTGKTNILQNVIRSLSEQYTPDEVSLYIIDFASMVLKNYEKLNHVGGVVCASEDEKLKNLFKLLKTEMEERKDKLVTAGVSSYAAYREAGRMDLTQIVLIIDNLTALKELYFQDDDELLGICREGITVGIAVVIANSQTSGIGYKYLSSFASRIALFCNDSSEYSMLYEHCSQRLDNIPGRCFVEVEKRYLECQAYQVFPGEKEFERATAIRAYISKRNEECKGMMARKIPLIPAILNMRYMEEFNGMLKGRFSIVSGLNYEDVMPYILDMDNLGVLAVSGREGAGRHNWIHYVVDMFELLYPGKSKVYILDSIEKRLIDLKEKVNVSSYSILSENVVSYLAEIEIKLKVRYEALVKDADIQKEEYYLLILENPDAVDLIGNQKEALDIYRNIIGRYRNLGVGVILSAVDNAPIPYNAPEILKGVRDTKHMMYFGDIAEMKVYDMPLMITRKFKKRIEVGDGYYIKDNECIKLKTPLSNEANL